MNARFWFLLIACLILANYCFAEERIVTIDPKTKLLTADQNGAIRLYRIADSAEITVNGAKASTQQLLPGLTIAVKTDAITAVKIAASGIGRPVATTPPALRSIIVQMRVDGTDRVLYKDGQLWIEHLSAQKPKDIFINGVEWSPNWNGDKTEPLTTFAIPLAPIGQGRVSLKQHSGRGKAKLDHSVMLPPP